MGNRLNGKVSALSSIPFEETDEVDFESYPRPVGRVAFGVGAGLLAMWIGPLIMAVSVLNSLRRDALSATIPDTGTVDHPTALPHRRAA
jgi:hypothetical protein